MMAQTTHTNKQSIWLWLVLIITIALTIWTSIQPENEHAGDDLVAPITRPEQNTAGLGGNTVKNPSTSTLASKQNTTQFNTWQAQHREAMAEKPGNLFPVHSWVVAPPVVKTKPAPPPPPVAPPTPFTYMGKMEDGPKGTLIFLIANNKVYSVAKGEKVDSFWRLDGEDANQLMFTFLPLNLPQTLSKTQPLTSQGPSGSAASAVN